LVGFSIYVAKLSKSTFSQLKFSVYSRQTIERIAKSVRYAKRIEVPVSDAGKRLLCTNDYNVTSAIYYSDDDNNPLTLSNNRLYYVRDVNAPGSSPRLIGRYISPLPGKPVFRYVDRTSAVEINFRVGDPTSDPKGVFNRETGPGPQGLDVHTAFGPRNSYLD
jgi:hypothetical protein